MFSWNDFGGLVERFRAFVHLNELAPIADVGSRAAAAAPAHLGTGASHGAKDQQKENSDGAHVKLLARRKQ
jgi:hypothetical protein